MVACHVADSPYELVPVGVYGHCTDALDWCAPTTEGPSRGFGSGPPPQSYTGDDAA